MTAATGTPVGVVAIVGDGLRHRWYVDRVATDPRIELRGVVCERKRPQPKGATEAEDRLIAEHFAERRAAEERFFAAAPALEERAEPMLAVPHGESNEPSVARWVAERAPEQVLLFGCSIIREPLLADFEDRVVNMHLGLSPYYRGAATNFWPLVNGEPECVGATIHIATLKVDAGPIVRQARPDMAPEDGSHDIGSKAVIAGADALCEALPALRDGALQPMAQRPGGRLYKNADFDAGQVEVMRRRLQDGLIADYLAEKSERDARFPIVE